MLNFIIVSLLSGFIFGTLDALINANPFAQRLFTAYKPIMRENINAALGSVIDVIYGFVMAGIFLVLMDSLPGSSMIVKGLSYGLLMWFFRVVMHAATHYVMFKVDMKLVAYTLVTGFVEMMILGVFFGAFLKPLG